MKKILIKVRKFFYLTEKDIGAKKYSAEEIVQIMNSKPINPKYLPIEFAKTLAKIYSKVS